MYPKDLSELTVTAIEAALLAGNILKNGYGTSFHVESKEGKHNLVTEFDHLSEKNIIEFIKSRFPHHAILSEECGDMGGTGAIQWVIDPLDGTVNFAHGLPMFAVSIAARNKEEILSAVVYHPLVNELFVAEKGSGAFLNGKQMRVTNVSLLNESILATGFPYNLIENPNHCIDYFCNFLKLGIPIRRMGVAALDLSYVAAGRFDGFWEVSLGPWDCAAGILLIEESGGKVTQWNQEPFSINSYKPIMASNGLIHDEMGQLLTKNS